VTDAQELRRVRRAQQFFRNAVLSSYAHKCCVTGIGEPALLRASHIVPWADREESRLDPANGLCLNALFDAAFDRGLLAIDDGFRLVASPKLSKRVEPRIHARFFKTFIGKRIVLPERNPPNPEFLRYHRIRALGR
jgi:predicted restriction endonuclease